MLMLLLLLLLLLLHALGVGSGQVRFGLARSGHEVGDEVDGQREDDGGVLLSADARQGLQIAKLQQKFALGQKKLRQSVFSGEGEKERHEIIHSVLLNKNSPNFSNEKYTT